jgi:parallel beta-helix repeat protein
MGLQYYSRRITAEYPVGECVDLNDWNLSGHLDILARPCHPNVRTSRKMRYGRSVLADSINMKCQRFLVVGLLVLTGCKGAVAIDPVSTLRQIFSKNPERHDVVAGPQFQRTLQEALIRATPGSVIMLPAGRHQLEAELSLTVPNVTVRGAGINQTILSFAGQTSGASGFRVSADGFAMEDLSLEETKGDALKINGAAGVTIRRVRAQWTGDPKESNGAYGFYPVHCQDVLIEDSEVSGASDAGIYVGQSSNVIVRRNRVEKNAAGIEVQNSQLTDVYENTVQGNASGILIFNLPDLPVKDGHHTRVFKNRIVNNNLTNFAVKGSLVASVPAGTGVMVLASHHVEVFNNTIEGNGDAGISIASYYATGNPIRDAHYYPFAESVYVHDNTITGGGATPNGRSEQAAKAAGSPLPSILFDGMINAQKAAQGMSGELPEEMRICIRNNGSATFANLDAANNYKKVGKDLEPYSCSLPSLEAAAVPLPAPDLTAANRAMSAAGVR